jgi:hypothetical protein
MAAKYQQAQQQPAQTEQQPQGELILGKFKTVDDLAKAYSELQKKLGQPKEQTEAQPGTEKPAGTTPLKVPEQPVQQQPAPLSAAMEKAAAEYDASGELTADTRKALVDAGIPEATIDVYLIGLKAQADAVRSEAYTLVGGEQNYAAMIEWAKTLPERNGLKAKRCLRFGMGLTFAQAPRAAISARSASLS